MTGHAGFPRSLGSSVVISLLLFLSGGCSHQPVRCITVRVISATVPRGDSLHITGNVDAFGNWVPDRVLLKQIADTVWEETFLLESQTDVTFKITRGSFRTEALHSLGPQYNSFSQFRVSGDTTITIACARWMDSDGGITPLKADDIVLNNGFWITNGWRYQPGDDPAWSSLSFNDSAWEIINTHLYPGEGPLSDWHNLGWFRLNLDVDSSLWNVPLAMHLWQVGASEVYLDGKPLYKFGVVGGSQEEEASFEDRNPRVIVFGAQRRHVLAVRYSNFTFAEYSWSRFRRMNMYAGFEIFLRNMNDAVAVRVATVRNTGVQQWLFTAIPVSFGFLHLMMFFFYPRFRENFYYACCMVGFGGITFASNQMSNTDSVVMLLCWNRVAQVSQMMAIVFGLFLFYSLLFKKIPRHTMFLVVPGIVLAIWSIVEPSRLFNAVKDAYTVAALLTMLWQMFRTRNMETRGGKIMGLGFLIVAVTVFYELSIGYGIITRVAGVADTYVYGALALGIGMSVFLSRRFARTNQELENQLNQVRELSVRTLAQERQAREAEIGRRILEADNTRKTRELDDARKLQLSMLPRTLPNVPDFDIAVSMKTATEVGGDYYDFAVAPDGTLTIALGDATGHGTAAGMMVVITKSLFDGFSRLPDLKRVFEEYTSSIKKLNLRSLFMALLLVRIKNRTLVASSAGMPPPLIYRAATGKVDQLPLKGMPLGNVLDFPYPQEETQLSPGDTIVLVSDGLPEMFNDKMEILGYARVKEIVGEEGHKTAHEIIDHLSHAGEIWSNGRPQDDDVTFVVLKTR